MQLYFNCGPRLHPVYSRPLLVFGAVTDAVLGVCARGGAPSYVLDSTILDIYSVAIPLLLNDLRKSKLACSLPARDIIVDISQAAPASANGPTSPTTQGPTTTSTQVATDRVTKGVPAHSRIDGESLHAQTVARITWTTIEPPRAAPEPSREAIRRGPPASPRAFAVTGPAVLFGEDIKTVMSVLRTIKSLEISEFAHDLRLYRNAEDKLNILLKYHHLMKCHERPLVHLNFSTSQGSRHPTIAKFMKNVSKRFFDTAESHTNALLHSVAFYEPTQFYHVIRRLRNVLTDPPDALTASESLIEVKDTND
ncbi:hypothetical protein EVAR_6489_1 [Eumeta japonica]|uniref:Uncharacterized protein n=1 Tax=Eumeta variegata TaxID=151549 RepID=A0A4C1SSE7_EUMVA|nr:hypothetical protein EVAR_6489_1 [Eumeta japonica]